MSVDMLTSLGAAAASPRPARAPRDAAKDAAPGRKDFATLLEEAPVAKGGARKPAKAVKGDRAEKPEPVEHAAETSQPVEARGPKPVRAGKAEAKPDEKKAGETDIAPAGEAPAPVVIAAAPVEAPAIEAAADGGDEIRPAATPVAGDRTPKVAAQRLEERAVAHEEAPIAPEVATPTTAAEPTNEAGESPEPIRPGKASPEVNAAPENEPQHKDAEAPDAPRAPAPAPVANDRAREVAAPQSAVVRAPEELPQNDAPRAEREAVPGRDAPRSDIGNRQAPGAPAPVAASDVPDLAAAEPTAADPVASPAPAEAGNAKAQPAPRPETGEATELLRLAAERTKPQAAPREERRDDVAVPDEAPRDARAPTEIAAHDGRGAAARFSFGAPIASTAIVGSIPASDVGSALGQQIVDLGVSGQWIADIAREIASIAANPGHGAFRIASPNLGAVQVSIVPGAQGSDVTLTVDTEAAQAALSSDRARLMQDAQLSSVRIGEVRIDRLAAPGEAARGDMGNGSHNGHASGQQGAQPQSGQTGQQGGSTARHDLGGMLGQGRNDNSPKAAFTRAVINDARDGGDAAPAQGRRQADTARYA